MTLNPLLRQIQLNNAPLNSNVFSPSLRAYQQQINQRFVSDALWLHNNIGPDDSHKVIHQSTGLRTPVEVQAWLNGVAGKRVLTLSSQKIELDKAHKEQVLIEVQKAAVAKRLLKDWLLLLSFELLNNQAALANIANMNIAERNQQIKPEEYKSILEHIDSLVKSIAEIEQKIMAIDTKIEAHRQSIEQLEEENKTLSDEVHEMNLAQEELDELNQDTDDLLKTASEVSQSRWSSVATKLYSIYALKRATESRVDNMMARMLLGDLGLLLASALEGSRSHFLQQSRSEQKSLSPRDFLLPKFKDLGLEIDNDDDASHLLGRDYYLVEVSPGQYQLAHELQPDDPLAHRRASHILHVDVHERLYVNKEKGELLVIPHYITDEVFEGMSREEQRQVASPSPLNIRPTGFARHIAKHKEKIAEKESAVDVLRKHVQELQESRQKLSTNLTEHEGSLDEQFSKLGSTINLDLDKPAADKHIIKTDIQGPSSTPLIQEVNLDGPSGPNGPQR